MCRGLAAVIGSENVDLSGHTRHPNVSVIDAQLEAAADGLLAGANPRLPSNGDSPRYVKDKLLWFSEEYEERSLEIRFFHDTPQFSLPSDVMMVAMRTGDRAVIFISEAALRVRCVQHRPMRPPFNARQRNDFAISLVHEIVHVQTINAVRPLRLLNQPLNPRFFEVDDALLACNDRLPCPGIERLYYITFWRLQLIENSCRTQHAWRVQMAVACSPIAHAGRVSLRLLERQP